MIDQAASWATVLSAASPLLAAVPIWMLQRFKSYIVREIAPQLTNGGTSTASYARQGRDVAAKALELAAATDARVGRLEAKVDSLILRAAAHEPVV